DLANSNPNVISLFIKMLRQIYGVNEKRLRVYLYCYENQNPEDIIEGLRSQGTDLLTKQRTFITAGGQIDAQTLSEKELALESYKGEGQLILERFRKQQRTNDVLNRLDIETIRKQAELARAQIGARPEERIRLENRGQLTGNISTLLDDLIKERPDFADTFNLENISTKLPELIDETQKRISDLSSIGNGGLFGQEISQSLKIEIDRLKALQDTQQKYNFLKQKQAELQKIALDDYKLENVFAEERLNALIKYNQENSRKGNFGLVGKNLRQTFFETNTFSANDFFNELSNNVSGFGKDFKQAFKDGFAQAATGAENLNEALRNIGLTISKNILTRASNLAVDTVFGLLLGNKSVTGGQGLLPKLLGSFAGNRYAGGGYVTGGSGNKDDVPVLLNGGEFVLNKLAAQKIGKNRLDILNSVSDVPSPKAKDILNYVPDYAANIAL
ncbi:MAG: hypothetical protein AABY22_17925, partial [Nanoarchaeota archaeon]